jgi:hypothetical protein
VRGCDILLPNIAKNSDGKSLRYSQLNRKAARRKMKRQSGGNDDRKGCAVSDPRVSGFLAGVLLLAFICAGYLVFVCIELALAKPRREHLFQVFVVRGERVYGTTTTICGTLSAYRGQGSFYWSNYEYSGRMMLTDARGGIGVGFLLQTENGKNVFYRLTRFCDESDFTLRGHGLGVEHGENTDARVSPKPWTWYAFKVRVEDEENQTRIRAKIWEERTPQPEEWKVDYRDRSPARNTRGSIALEAAGKGEKFFDDLRVRRIDVAEESHSSGGAIPLYYEEDFEGYPVGSHPIGWQDQTQRMDVSDVADSLSRFFGMEIFDFAGPWDEVVNLTAMFLMFGSAGLLAGIARTRSTGSGRGQTPGRRASGIFLAFVPFLLLFVYAGAPKGMLVILYVPAAVVAALAWTLLERAVAVILSPSR